MLAHRKEKEIHLLLLLKTMQKSRSRGTGDLTLTQSLRYKARVLLSVSTLHWVRYIYKEKTKRHDGNTLRH